MTDIRQKLEEALAAGFTDQTLTKAREQLSEAVDEMADQLEDDLKSNLSYNLAYFVERMADEAIEAMLNGDDDEMRKRLRCQEGHYTGRDRDHPVIHGKLFEARAIELRKKVVDAHADLLKSERILDLEAQVKSLVEQVRKAEADREAMYQRSRAASALT